jgi:hypothetical protein
MSVSVSVGARRIERGGADGGVKRISRLRRREESGQRRGGLATTTAAGGFAGARRGIGAVRGAGGARTGRRRLRDLEGRYRRRRLRQELSGVVFDSAFDRSALAPEGPGILRRPYVAFSSAGGQLGYVPAMPEDQSPAVITMRKSSRSPLARVVRTSAKHYPNGRIVAGDHKSGHETTTPHAN